MNQPIASEPVVVQPQHRIREVRLRLGFSQNDLAEAMGCERQIISRLERLDVEPRISTLRQIAKAMGCRIVDLLPDEGNEADPGANETLT